MLRLSRVRLFALPLFLLACAAVSRPAAADPVVLFNNMGAGQNSFTADNGWNFGNVLGFGAVNLTSAVSFTAASTANLANVVVPLTLVFPATGTASGNFTISLTQNNAGQPGTLIEDWIVPASNLGTANNPALITYFSSLTPLLTAGTQYWLTVSGNSALKGFWNLNNTGDTLTDSVMNTFGGSPPVWNIVSSSIPSDIRGAMAVNGVTPVPLPAAGWLLLSGLGGLGALARRRKAVAA
jgi:hypothetical protein